MKVCRKLVRHGYYTKIIRSSLESFFFSSFLFINDRGDKRHKTVNFKYTTTVVNKARRVVLTFYDILKNCSIYCIKQLPIVLHCNIVMIIGFILKLQVDVARLNADIIQQ